MKYVQYVHVGTGAFVWSRGLCSRQCEPRQATTFNSELMATISGNETTVTPTQFQT